MGSGETRLGAGKLDLALRRLRQLFRPRVEVTKPPANIRVDRDVPVKMRDGVTLRVNLHRPEGEGPLPVILSAHPYGKDKIPARSRSGRGSISNTICFRSPT